jgi:hypothetical protein
MSWSVNLAGQTFTDANVEGTAYADEQSGFPAILAAIASETRFLKGLGATSATPLAPGLGAISLTTDQQAAVSVIPVGALVQVKSQSNPGIYMVGTVTAFVETTLSISVTIAVGGLASDWVIGIPNTSLNELVRDLCVNDFAITSRNNGNVVITPHGTGLSSLKNLNASGSAVFTGPIRVDAGGELRGTSLGALTGTVNITPNTTQFAYGTIVGDCILSVAPPSLPGYGYSILLKIQQDGTGGRTATVQSSNGAMLGVWLGDPVEWTLRGPGAWNYISVFWTPAGDLLISNLGGSL